MLSVLRRFFVALLALGLLAGMAGTNPTHAQAGEGSLRVYNLLPDDGSNEELVVLLDGEVAFDGVPADYLTDTITATAATYRLSVEGPAGGELFNIELTIEADTLTTLVLVETGGALGGVAVVSELQPEADKASVNFVHALAGGPNINVQTGDNTIVESLAFGEFTSVPADQDIYPITINDVDSGSNVLDLGQQGFVNNIVYTYIVHGTPEAPTYSKLSDGQLLIGSINASANTPPVDVYINDELVFEAVAYKSFSQLNYWNSGRYRIALRLNGTAADSEPLFENSIIFSGGVAANLVIMGRQNGQGEEELIINSYWPAPILPAGRSSINLIHALPGGPGIDLIENNAVIENLLYQEIDSVTGPAQVYNLSVTPNGDPSTILVDLTGFELLAIKNHTIIVTGSLDSVEILNFYSDPYTVIVAGQ
jgi:hypothetical protein